MINPRDTYTAQTIVPMIDGELTVGVTIMQYEIHRSQDLMNLADTFAYDVLCTQRVVIPNAHPYEPGATAQASGGVIAYSGYPAILTNQITILQATDGGAEPEAVLTDYVPRTLNASVATSISNSSGSAAATTMQHTSGSSTSQTNSFDASATLGFFGSALTGGVTVSDGHSSSIEHARSRSSGHQNGHNRQSGASDSMAVKDWACYAYLGSPNDQMMPPTISPNLTTVNWIWGQQYPWDVIQFRYSSGSGSNAPITLPNFVTMLLYDGTQLFPPSQLAQFGLDFTMKALWRVKPRDVGAITLQHTIGYVTASHSLNGDVVQAAFDKIIQFQPITSPALNVCLYGLDPIGLPSGSSLATIGFVPRRFLTRPVPAAISKGAVVNPTPFAILSTSNNLFIKDATAYSALTSADADAGFTASQTALTATFTPNCTSLQMTVSFKILDTMSEYWLFMKHWKVGTPCTVLTIIINDDAAGAITRYVDAEEAEGGQDNLLSLSLRDLNYGSIDYHDFLQLGLNTITIALRPLDGKVSSCSYQMRALSIERRG